MVSTAAFRIVRGLNLCPATRFVMTFLAGLFVLIGVAAPALAQGFPNRPITLLVGQPAGGTADNQTRALAAAAAKHLRQPIVIINKPGVAATLAVTEMLQAAPDGYTLALSPSSLWRLPHMQKVSWDPMNDFSLVMAFTNILIGVTVPKESPFQSLPELLAYAKANPNKVTIGSASIQGSGAIATHLLGKMAGIQTIHVPYKGAVDLYPALIGGQVQVAIEGGFPPHVDNGLVRLLAILDTQRAKRWPNVPTASELGYDIVSTAVFGIAGPKGMDPAVVRVLNDAFQKATLDPAFQKSLDTAGQPLVYMGSDEYTKFAKRQTLLEKRTLDEIGFVFGK